MLHALAKQGALHGSAVIAYAADRTGGRMKIMEGSVYPTLWSLHRDGLIERVPSIGRRISYSLTSAGQLAADEVAGVVREFFDV